MTLTGLPIEVLAQVIGDCGGIPDPSMLMIATIVPYNARLKEAWSLALLLEFRRIKEKCDYVYTGK